MCMKRWSRLYVFYSTHPILVQRFIMLRQCQYKNFISNQELCVFSRTHALPPFLTSKKFSIKFIAFLFSNTQPKGSHTWKKYQRDIILKVKKSKSLYRDVTIQISLSHRLKLLEIIDRQINPNENNFSAKIKF